jgi:hypothetical protein
MDHEHDPVEIEELVEVVALEAGLVLINDLDSAGSDEAERGVEALSEVVSVDVDADQ